jgi:hypothetical protein
MCQNNFVRTSTDQLRLATSVSKLEPTYLSRNADSQQTVEDLISTWFRSSQGTHVPTIFVIIVREISDNNEPMLSTKKEEGDMKLKIKKEKKDKKPVRQITKKRSLSMADINETEEDKELLATSELVAYRTRNRHILNEEDEDRIAQYN